MSFIFSHDLLSKKKKYKKYHFIFKNQIRLSNEARFCDINITEDLPWRLDNYSRTVFLALLICKSQIGSRLLQVCQQISFRRNLTDLILVIILKLALIYQKA